MTTFELLAILTVAACFLCALAYIVSEEKKEFNYFKTWKW